MSAQNTNSTPAMPIVGQSRYQVVGTPLAKARTAKPHPDIVQRSDKIITATRLSCCGLFEVSGISYFRDRPEQCLLALALKNMFFTTGAIIFTDASYEEEDYNDEDDDYERVVEWPRYGTQLKNEIEVNNLGPVTVSESFHNYNSGNMVRVYLWVPDGAAVRHWVKEKYSEYYKYFNGERPVEYES